MKRSKSSFGRAKIVILATGALFFFCVPACGPLSGMDAGATRTFRVPWPSADGSYQLQNVEINGFDSPDTLQGHAANILVDPYEADGRLQSSTPAGHFARTAAGVMVPGDYVSLISAAIQGHMDRLRKLNADVGVTENQVAWPVTVGVEANVVSAAKKNVVRNNAIFEKRLNALLMVPYSDSALPIGVNGGILAHEHFHRIFQAIVLSALKEKPPERKTAIDIFNETLLRAMNEGFADFWGYLYLGDANFIGRSLPTENARRTLALQAGRLPSVSELQHILTFPQYRDEDVRVGLAYEKGTIYARLLRELSQSAGEQRLLVARALIKSLTDLRDLALAAQTSNSRLSPNAILKPLHAKLAAGDQICVILQRVQSRDWLSFDEESTAQTVDSDPTGCGK